MCCTTVTHVFFSCNFLYQAVHFNSVISVTSAATVQSLRINNNDITKNKYWPFHHYTYTTFVTEDPRI